MKCEEFDHGRRTEINAMLGWKASVKHRYSSLSMSYIGETLETLSRHRRAMGK